MTDPGPLLSLRDVTIAFGGVRAVDGVSFDVPRGAIVSLIGPNGAGKTTALNGISGFVRARGAMRYRDIDLLRAPAYRRASLGIGRTFQNLQLFADMTLLENLLVGAHSHIGGNLFTDLLPVAGRGSEHDARSRTKEVLALLDIAQYAGRKAGELPFGVQKLAGVARALAGGPQLLLLDEPAAGLNRAEASRLAGVITGLRSDLGLTILLVEHNMRLVMQMSDHVVVLDGGRKLVEGTPADVSHDQRVIEAYLGASAQTADS